jgi:hypothetical protein
MDSDQAAWLRKPTRPDGWRDETMHRQPPEIVPGSDRKIGDLP